jgi:glycosyltransferase involved in cell wall biosynthesis
MRVAVVTPYPAAGARARGGVEVAALRLASSLHRRGVDVTVVAVHGPPGYREMPFPIIGLETDERWSLLRNLRPMRKALSRALDDVQADLVHAQGVVPAGYAATGASANGAPLVITVHGSRRNDTMSLYTGPAASARWLLGRRMTLSALARAQAVVGVHPDWRVNLPAPPSRFTYIPNIVDEHFFATTRRRDPVRVLYCGGDAAIKGWRLLLSAWGLVLDRLPEARLRAVGFAGATSVIPESVAHSVDLDGLLSSEQLAQAMAEAAVVVIPSQYEVAPTVLAEAWATRVPVVATAVGGVPRLAYGAAILVEREDRERLAQALIRALRDDDAVEAAVEEGYRRSQRHREESVVAAHLELYGSLVPSRHTT